MDGGQSNNGEQLATETILFGLRLLIFACVSPLSHPGNLVVVIAA
jgi:hypothetical protein